MFQVKCMIAALALLHVCAEQDLVSQEISLLEEEIAQAQQRMLDLQTLRAKLTKEAPASPLLADIPDVASLFSSGVKSGLDPSGIPDDHLQTKFTTHGLFASVVTLTRPRFAQGYTAPPALVVVIDAQNVKLYTPEGDCVVDEPHGARGRVTHLIPTLDTRDHTSFVVLSTDAGETHGRRFQIKHHFVRWADPGTSGSEMKRSKYLDVLPLNLTLEKLSFDLPQPVHIVPCGRALLLTTPANTTHLVYTHNATRAPYPLPCVPIRLTTYVHQVVVTCADSLLVLTCDSDSIREITHCALRVSWATLVSRTQLITYDGHLAAWSIARKECSKKMDFPDGLTFAPPDRAHALTRPYVLLAASDERVLIDVEKGLLEWAQQENAAHGESAHVGIHGSDLLVHVETDGVVRVRDIFFETTTEQDVSEGFSFKGPLMGIVMVLVVGWQVAKQRPETAPERGFGMPPGEGFGKRGVEGFGKRVSEGFGSQGSEGFGRDGNGGLGMRVKDASEGFGRDGNGGLGMRDAFGERGASTQGGRHAADSGIRFRG